MRRASFTLMAISAAIGDVGKPWFEAIAKTDEEADAMFERHKVMENLRSAGY